jgi:hypothetical protein
VLTNLARGRKGRHNEKINAHENRRRARHWCGVSGWRHSRATRSARTHRFYGALDSEIDPKCAQLRDHQLTQLVQQMRR